MTRVLLVLLAFYQKVISPMFGPTCRYYPSCSAYAVEALRLHGATRGSWLAARRLGRCHPWAPGGVDHVPSRDSYRWWGRCPGCDVIVTGDEAAEPVPPPAREGV
jgi:putative membrane protein insertion efficiency factor